MISHHHRCIFVHIPKTAGNSINRVFGVDWQDHKDLASYAAEQPGEVFDNYFKFAIVRNPWDRLFSDYNYQRKKSRAPDSKLFVFNENGRQRNFAAWVETALAQATHYAPERWGGQVSPHIHRWSPQVEWISVAGEPAVDFVARLENLTEDFPVICRHLGLPSRRLPRRNRRLHWHYSHYYDRTTREMVSAYYARDIDAFGYDFEDHTFHFRIFRPAAWLDEVTSDKDDSPALETPPPRDSTSFTSYPSYRRPPARRSRLNALLTVTVLSIGGWLGLGLLESTHIIASGLTERPPLSRTLAQLLVPLSPRVARPAGVRKSLALAQTLELTAAMFPATTPVPALAALSDEENENDPTSPATVARAAGSTSSIAPSFGFFYRDWSLLRRRRPGTP